MRNVGAKTKQKLLPHGSASHAAEIKMLVKEEVGNP